MVPVDGTFEKDRNRESGNKLYSKLEMISSYICFFVVVLFGRCSCCCGFFNAKFLVSGANACLQLGLYGEAITWCDKGLAVSY